MGDWPSLPVSYPVKSAPNASLRTEKFHDRVSEVRREVKGTAVHAEAPWTRARRVGAPGPSSWST